MGTVICTARHPIDLSDGRMLGPGESADDVDTNHPHQRALVLDGHLRVEEGRTPRKRQAAKLADAVAADEERE